MRFKLETCENKFFFAVDVSLLYFFNKKLINLVYIPEKQDLIRNICNLVAFQKNMLTKFYDRFKTNFVKT